MKTIAPVAITPTPTNTPSIRFFTAAKSAIAPSTGADSATMAIESEVIQAKRAVASGPVSPDATATSWK